MKPEHTLPSWLHTRPQLPPLWDGDENSTHSVGLLWGLKGVKRARHLGIPQPCEPAPWWPTVIIRGPQVGMRAHVYTQRDTAGHGANARTRIPRRQPPDQIQTPPTTVMILNDSTHRSQSSRHFMRTKIVNVGEIDKNNNSCDSEIWKELGRCIYKKHISVFIVQ